MMFAVRMSSVKVGKTSMRKCTVKEKRKTRSRRSQTISRTCRWRGEGRGWRGGGGRMEGRPLERTGLILSFVNMWESGER